MEALRPLTKQGALNTGSVLLVGAEYLPLDELAAAILKENKSFEVNVHLAKCLPLPVENEHTRPRIDLIVFLIDVRSQHSVEVVRSSLAYVDVNFFLGKVCFLAVGVYREKSGDSQEAPSDAEGCSRPGPGSVSPCSQLIDSTFLQD
ncbi:centromere protein M isoform X3 [Leucoraja erinacea]|uniref:centromere protein M isoform X3 n=1 Tax=Leucoraja erinaceus TaxID=7782 RepID=UPI002456D5A8|nr:centromere protein M isoform X3 [Leucoraja erinacea]